MITPIFDDYTSKPMYMQIRDYIVEEIKSGRLSKDTRLPSVRKFSKHLEVSRTSIENAYNQLLAEGYIISRPQKGYYVESLNFVYTPVEIVEEGTEQEVDQEPIRYDFTNGSTSTDTFDFRLWKKHINYVINYQEGQLFESTSIKGEHALREAISHHFYRSRGVVSHPKNIVIGSGVSPLLSMLMTLFTVRGIHHIAVEDPGFNKAYGVFRGGGFDVTPIEMTLEGMNIEELIRSGARACYVSPSHHFPTGTIMPIKDRQQILKWARENEGYIIEDDYNFQLRYEGQPIPSMQSMDSSGRVIYLGSFSTVLAPAIRISFMVLPDTLTSLFEEHDSMFPQTASKLEQLALARLIEGGDFDKHIRKMRLHYAKIQKKTLQCMDAYFPESIQAINVKAGLQVILKLPEFITESAFEEDLLKRQIRVEGLNHYRINKNRDSDPYLVFSYRGIGESLIETSIEELGDIFSDVLKV